MLQYLVDHARRNVWCTPDQDLQVIFKPARITPSHGSTRHIDVQWRRVPLPDGSSKFHVYQIGQRHPSHLGLVDRREEWIPIPEVCALENLIVDLYVKSGQQYPRFQSWIRVGPNKTLLVAVRIADRLPNLENQPLFIRFYSNAYYNSVRRNANEDIRVQGLTVTENADRIHLKREYLDCLELPGHTYAFNNGRLVHDFTPSNTKVGDHLEFVHDGSIHRIVDLEIDELDTFDSLLDAKRKYLLHYDAMLNESIDFRDDIDLWLIKPNDDGVGFRGIYYHKNAADAVRMVTHKDYSIPVAYVNGFVNDNPEWSNLQGVRVRLHIRSAGYYRPLIDEHNRIKELYKMGPVEVRRALLGIDSNVPEWRADNLELSSYIKLMSDLDGIYDLSLVQDAYGYNATSRLLADTPQRLSLDGGAPQVTLPIGLRAHATVFEYDHQGLLLGFHYHASGETYIAQNPAARTIEVFSGLGSEGQGTVFGEMRFPLEPGINYRFYRSPMVNSAPTNEWEDVTDDTSLHYMEGNELVWTLDASKWQTAVRRDDHFLAYEHTLLYNDGMLHFNVVAREPRYGIVNRQAAHIPPARLNLWLNGHSLIEGLDYHVKWPEVVICNKKFLVPGIEQQLVVRAFGFCSKDMEREPPSEFGFVEHGLLSRNRRFDIRDDKIIRLVVDGALHHRDEIYFSEDHTGAMMSDIPNGSPYLVEDGIVPIRGLVGTDPYAYRDRSRQVDQRISDYLTVKSPEPGISEPSMIPERYAVFSPFFNRVMHDVQQGVIDNSFMGEHYSDAHIKEILKPYTWLLGFDPVKLGVNENYVLVHPHRFPHEVELNIFQYNFMRRVIQVYLDGDLNMASHVRLAEWEN